MKKCLVILTVFFVLLINSCGLKRGYLKFDNRNDELIATEKIKDFIKQNPQPSIVLRVPISEKNATDADQNSYIYTAIEKELVLAGFVLRDRGLFNEVVSSQAALNYSKIVELTNTDLILELVKVDTKIPFKTNKAYKKDGTEVILKKLSYTRLGASIEFKLILVKSNEYGGSYSFTYAPCTEKNDNCYCQVPYKTSNKFYPDYKLNWCTIDNKGKDKKKLNDATPTAYETIPQNEFEIFVRNGVKKVIGSIKQN